MPQYQSPGVYVEQVAGGIQPIAGVGTSTAAFIGIVPDTVTVPTRNDAYDPTAADSDTNRPYTDTTVTLAAAEGEVRLCTNFAEFTRSFGGFSTNEGQRNLAHAVYGFFNNGGTRCYVVREADAAGILGSAL